MRIVEHTCLQLIVRHADGSYTATATDERPITHCPSCGGELADEYLAARGRRVKRDDDDRRER